jgi:RNA-directed DNA polymerase
VKATNHTTDMNASRKSDRCIVPGKHSNKDELTPSAESVEGRQMTKGNTVQPTAARTQGRKTASKGLERVREAARKDKKMRFTALLHHVNFDLLKESFYQLRKEAAAGVDGITWEEYEEGLDERLRNLLDRVHKGSYRAKPSKRTYIHKEDGKMRPLGIASLEDKVVQQAVVKILNCIYEADFKGFSYGFRPGRNQHQALDAVTVGICSRKINWVLDADIRGFFDAINHEWLCKFLEHRIADQRILLLIRKWLRAGVSEDGEWSETKVGTPQGSLCKALHNDPYAKKVIMQSKSDNSLKMSHHLLIYFA